MCDLPLAVIFHIFPELLDLLSLFVALPSIIATNVELTDIWVPETLLVFCFQWSLLLGLWTCINLSPFTEHVSVYILLKCNSFSPIHFRFSIVWEFYCLLQSPINYQAMRLIKRNLDDSIRPERHDSFASRIDGVDTRDSKRHKKLSYGPLNVCTNNMNHMVASSQAENLGTNCCQSEDKSVPPHNGAQPLALLDDLSTGKIICEFCQSSRISKVKYPFFAWSI